MRALRLAVTISCVWLVALLLCIQLIANLANATHYSTDDNANASRDAPTVTQRAESEFDGAPRGTCGELLFDKEEEEDGEIEEEKVTLDIKTNSTNNSNRNKNKNYDEDDEDEDEDVDEDNDNDNDNDDDDYVDYGAYVISPTNNNSKVNDSLEKRQMLEEQRIGAVMFFAVPKQELRNNQIRDKLVKGADLPNLTSSYFSNKTDENIELGERHEIHYSQLILLVFPIMAAFGNLLVILAVYLERSLQSVTNYFIVSLAFSDLLVGVIVMPFAVYVLVSRKSLIRELSLLRLLERITQCINST